MGPKAMRRQHLAAVYIDGCWNFVSFFFYFVAYRFVSGGGLALDTGSVVFISYVVVLGFFSLIFSFLSWWCFTYAVDEAGVLRVRTGLLFRKNREIRKDRVQVVDIEAGPLQQICGVVSLKIETAGGKGEPEVVFKALKKTVAERLKADLEGVPHSEATADGPVPHTSEYDGGLSEPSESVSEPGREKLFSLPTRDLFLFAATSGRLGYIFAGGYFIFGQLPPERIAQLERYLSDSILSVDASVVLFFGLLLFLLAWLISVVAEMFRFATFSINQRRDGISISYGLLKKRRFDIQSDKMRSIVLRENFIRRLFGIASLHVEVNCGKEKSSKEIILVCPLIRIGDVEPFRQRCLPSLPEVPEAFDAPPLRSAHRYILRKVLLGLGIYFAFWYLSDSSTLVQFLSEPLQGVEFSTRQLLSSAVWLFLCGYFGFLEWRYSGIAFNEEGVAIRNFGFALNTTVLKRRSVLGVQLKAHPLMRLSRVSTIAMLVASGESSRTFRFASYASSQKAFRWYYRTHGETQALKL